MVGAVAGVRPRPPLASPGRARGGPPRSQATRSIRVASALPPPSPIGRSPGRAARSPGCRRPIAQPMPEAPNGWSSAIAPRRRWPGRGRRRPRRPGPAPRRRSPFDCGPLPGAPRVWARRSTGWIPARGAGGPRVGEWSADGVNDAASSGPPRAVTPPHRRPARSARPRAQPGRPSITRQLVVAVATVFPVPSTISASAKATRRPGLVTRPVARRVPLAVVTGRR